MANCLIKNSEYRTKLAQSGVPELKFYAFANQFVNKYGRFPNLDEIPVDKLNILIDKMGVIIENSTSEKPYAFDLYLVLDFIDKTSQEILESLKPKEEII